MYNLWHLSSYFAFTSSADVNLAGDPSGKPCLVDSLKQPCKLRVTTGNTDGRIILEKMWTCRANRARATGIEHARLISYDLPEAVANM